MKRIVLLLVIISSVWSLKAQNNIKFSSKFENLYYKSFDYFGDYGLTDIGLGINIQNKTTDIPIYIMYGVLYNYPVPKEWVKGYAIINQYIGFSSAYHFLNKNNLFRPYFEIKTLYEIKTNYRNGKLDLDTYVPSLFDGFAGNYDCSHGPGPCKLVSSYANFYYATSFVGSINGGCSIRLVDNLHLNVAVGYGLMVMKYKYLEWEKGSDYKELLKNIPAKTKNFNYVDFQLGLSYTFSFKKSKSN